MHVLEIVSALKKHRSFSADQQKKYDPTRYGLQYTNPQSILVIAVYFSNGSKPPYTMARGDCPAVNTGIKVPVSKRSQRLLQLELRIPLYVRSAWKEMMWFH